MGGEVTAQAPTVEGLRGRVLRGFAWKTASEVFLQGSKIVIAVVLARLLSPRDYGIAGMALVFAAVVPILSELALGAALVQRKHITEGDKSTVFWTTVTTGALLTALGILASWPLSDYYGEPSVQPLFASFSFAFLIFALGATHSALMTRDMNFRGLEIRTITAVTLGATVGIILALEGYGAWAIVGQYLATATASLILLWAFCTWRPRFTYSLSSLRALASYGGNVFGSHVLLQLAPNAQNLMIGRALGAAPLGAFVLAQNVVLIPFNRIAAPIQQVLFPAFSLLQDEPRAIAAMWLRANQVIAAISVPALLGLIVVAPDFVNLVLGGRWGGATPVIQALAIVGIVQALQRLNLSILQARNRTKALLWFSVGSFVAAVSSVVIGLHWGVVGVAISYAVVTIFVQGAFMAITARAVEISLRECLGSLSGITQAGAGMLVCTLLVRAALVEAGVATAQRLAIVVLTGVGTFVPLMLWRASDVVNAVTSLRREGRADLEQTPSQ